MYVRTIKDWNDLPPDIQGIDDYEAFKTSPSTEASKISQMFLNCTCTYVFNEHMMDGVQYYAFV
jgi:hypothetical protein